MNTSDIETEVRDASGLHARPAAAFVALAARFGSSISVRNLSREKGPVSAKSIIGILGLGVSQGHRIRIEAEGDDAELATRALADLVSAVGGAGEGDPG